VDDFREEVLEQALRGTADSLFVSYGRKGAHDGSAVGVILKREGTKGSNLIEVHCDCGWPGQAVHQTDFRGWVCRNCSLGIGEARIVEEPS
jgi:hypothetical protein